MFETLFCFYKLHSSIILYTSLLPLLHIHFTIHLCSQYTIYTLFVSFACLFFVLHVIYLCFVCLFLITSRGSQHDIRESSPDIYGSLGRKQRYVCITVVFLSLLVVVYCFVFIVVDYVCVSLRSNNLISLKKN